MRQLGNGAHRRDLHFLVDHRGAHVERSAEDEREAQHVVDLVGKVRPAGAHNRVRASCLGHIGHDFGIGIGQRQNQRRRRHLGQHFGLQRARCRQAEEHVRALDHLGERRRIRFAAELPAPLVVDVVALVGNQAVLVRHPDILVLGAQRHQHVEAGNGRGPCPGRADLYVLDLLALELEPIEHCGADDDRGAMLVVMEHWNRHALTQRFLDFKAIGRADVFEVDSAEGRPQRGHGIDEFLRVSFVDLQIEHVDAGELLEQDRLAFHDRLGGQRADIAQPEHGGTVGNHRHQVLARRVTRHRVRVFSNFLAGRSYSGRIGQRQVALVTERFCGLNFKLSGLGKFVKMQSRIAKILALVIGISRQNVPPCRTYAWRVCGRVGAINPMG